MSLYNALFGRNDDAGTLLQLLGLTEGDVPRFRDVFLNPEGTEITVYTRTGGGNRSGYIQENMRLMKTKGYLRDQDDEFDSTYAEFVFAVPIPAQPLVQALLKAGAAERPLPRARWDRLLTKLKEGDKSDPEVQRALAVGEQIKKQFESGESVAEV